MIASANTNLYLLCFRTGVVYGLYRSEISNSPTCGKKSLWSSSRDSNVFLDGLFCCWKQCPVIPFCFCAALASLSCAVGKYSVSNGLLQTARMIASANTNLYLLCFRTGVVYGLYRSEISNSPTVWQRNPCGVPLGIQCVSGCR
ncbi:hypothetical protein C4D60_Mb10t00410 [Musa balbisiana]|uniref:Uncharacterized protein n=1 Tax=Musa balbisiana TaxID=52838 RepID=A0A4S8ITK2_MUSBA|nr:hypothetical protein C4D60_Mb10t00410 [Musa balbisiana]